MRHIFTERDGSFSWRKAGTALCFLLFFICSLGNVIANHWAQLPDGYLIIISGVFAFYFLKKPLENFSFSTKDKANISSNV